MSNPQLLSGARGLIQRFDPISQTFQTLAFATDINVNIRVGVRQTFTVGAMNATAIDSLSYDVDASVGRVIPVNAPDAPQTADGSAAPRTSSVTAIDIGLETLINQMVTAGDLIIALQDKVTGNYFSSVRGCRFSGRSMSMNAQDIGNERLNFTGIYDSGYNNENSATDGYGL